MSDDHLGRGVVSGPLLQLLLEGLENSGREGGRAIRSLQGGAGGVGEVRSNRGIRRASNKAENTEAVEDALDGQLLWNVVGAIKHHIGVLEVPMTNLRKHPTEAKCIHTEQITNT